MRVLTIIDSLGRGGAEQALVNLLPEIQRQGVGCEVAFLWEPSELAIELQNLGIKVHHINLQNRWDLINNARRIKDLAIRTQADILHAHLFFSVLYTSLVTRTIYNPRREIYKVATFHDLDYLNYPAISIPAKSRQFVHLKLIKRGFSGYSAVSQAIADHYSQLTGLHSIQVVHNAFPLEKLRPDPALNRANVRSRYGIALEDFMLVMTARLTIPKGHRYLFESLGILRRKSLYPRVLLLGSGPLEGELKRDMQQRQLDNQVVFGGSVPHAELLQAVQSADALILASLQEGFGLAPAEAMALERPVIGTNSGGLPDLVENDKSGLLVAPGKSEALATAIAQVMQDPTLRDGLGKAGRKRLEKHFSTQVIASQWLQFYKELVRSKSS